MPLWFNRAFVPLFFAFLALLFVSPALIPGRALLPIDNLFLYPPWSAHAADFGVARPHNQLIGDAILQNYSWKRFAAESYARGEFPLWNPYILAGQPFLASAQNGSLYPLGALFFVMPISYAYAWFIALHLWIGALGAYWLVRMLGATRGGGMVAGVAFAFCGYLVVSFLWPMVVSTAIWLPWILGIVERLIRKPTPLLVAIGSVLVGLQFLAGHLEMSLLLLISAGLYAGLRLLAEVVARGASQAVIAGSAALLMVICGAMLAGIQLVPFAEVAAANVRGGWSDYSETVGYALSRDRLVSWLVPDYFGNPSHRSYLDVSDLRLHSVEHTRPNGEPRIDTEWGGKNYVEGTTFVGVMTLLLAIVGLVVAPNAVRLSIGGLALISMLLAFGTPLYAVLFHAVPGVNQLHTPFRWIYPLSLCLAVLAGLGASGLGRSAWAGRIGLLAATVGLLGVAGFIVVLLFRDQAIEIAAGALRRWPDLSGGFDDPRVFLSYQLWNIVGAIILLGVGGLVLWFGARGRARLAVPIAILLVAGDLLAFGIGFNSASETSALGLTPDAIRAIQGDRDIFRVVTYGEDDTLPPNTNMLFGLQDVRGYDTIILRDYVDYLELLEQQTGIAYSKVAKLFDQRSLSSPLIDLLNVRYVLTSKSVSQPGWTLVHQGEGIRIYRNDQALPRAFVVIGAQPAPDIQTARDLVSRPDFDPSQTVVLEGWDGASRPPGGPMKPAEIVEYSGNRVAMRTSTTEPGFLVLADVMFPGWTVTVDGEPRQPMRANGLIRAVELAPGDHFVIFEYKPLSFRIGALLTLVGAIAIGLIAAMAALPRLAGLPGGASPAQRVLRNSAFPMATSLINKVMEVGFALVMFRVLQAEGVGAYTFAGVLVGYLDILVGFGLGTLMTREVAREPQSAARFLGSSIGLRLLLWFLSLGVVGVLVGPLAEPLGITPPQALTIWLLMIAVLPGILSSALTALFQAHERMELPSLVTVLTTMLKVALGLLALMVGLGYVGLAAVALATGAATAVVLTVLYVRTLGWPGWQVDLAFSRWMAAASLPLLANSLLNSLFFRIDAVLLKPISGDIALGWYSTAYKFIDGLQIIPSSFVLALFPLMSRYAESDRAKLAHVVRVALKTLLTLALPISVGTTLLADWLILIFAGSTYLPEAATALQILIWFLPLSFANGLLQYVLISVNRQRWITLSFAIGATFNLLANLALIPRYGYLAASVVTVLSELVLLAPFWWAARQELVPVGLPGLLWRPAVAALVMAVPVWALRDISALLAIPVGAAIYGLSVLALGGVDQSDRAVLRSLLSRQRESIRA